MELYRMKSVKTTGSASWGQWEYFEDVEKLKVSLLRAYLNAEKANNKRVWVKHMLNSLWSDYLSDDSKTKTERILSVEQAVDNEWRPVQVEFIHPEVKIID